MFDAVVVAGIDRYDLAYLGENVVKEKEYLSAIAAIGLLDFRWLFLQLCKADGLRGSGALQIGCLTLGWVSRHDGPARRQALHHQLRLGGDIVSPGSDIPSGAESTANNFGAPLSWKLLDFLFLIK